MKTEKETKQDELAAIGIGAMIVFIALILVAAVAAAVIIQTAEKLQQNAQSSGDDTQEQMSTKLTLINIVIETIDDAGGNYDLFATFELAPGSEPTEGDDIGYTVICSDDQGTPANAADDTTEFAQGDLTGATLHTGDGAGVAAITLNPGSTYVVVLDIDECAPAANTDHILIFTVTGGGSTYEELQYGSSPTVGDVVV
jgi:flagellin FlaB